MKKQNLCMRLSLHCCGVLNISAQLEIRPSLQALQSKVWVNVTPPAFELDKAYSLLQVFLRHFFETHDIFSSGDTITRFLEREKRHG